MRRSFDALRLLRMTRAIVVNARRMHASALRLLEQTIHKNGAPLGVLRQKMQRY